MRGARLAVGTVLAVSGIAAFHVVTILQPALRDGGIRAALALGPTDPSLHAEPTVLLLGAHDLRLTALVAVLCGTVLGLSAVLPRSLGRRLLIGTSVLAAGTVPLLAFDRAEGPVLATFVPAGYLAVLRTVQVLLVVAAIAAPLAAGRVDRPNALLALGVAGLLALSIVTGLHGAATYSPVTGQPAVPLSGALGAVALFLVWTGARLPLRGMEVGAFVATAVAVPLVYTWARVPALPLTHASMALAGSGGAEPWLVEPWIGLGMVWGAALLGVHFLMLARLRAAHAYPVAAPPPRPV